MKLVAVLFLLVAVICSVEVNYKLLLQFRSKDMYKVYLFIFDAQSQVFARASDIQKVEAVPILSPALKAALAFENIDPAEWNLSAEEWAKVESFVASNAFNYK